MPGGLTLSMLKTIVKIVFTIQLLILNASSLYAWEFNLTGSLMWSYETYSQQGRSGFFGPYDSDASATASQNSAANLNLWNGIPRVFNVQMASGSDVATSYIQADFWPTIKINPALDIKARLRIGGYGGYYDYGNYNRYQYTNWTNPGTLNDVGISAPLLWGTAHTPWGTVSYGKRPLPFGIGLQYDGNSNLTTESLSLKTAYGPLTIVLGFYPKRQAPTNTIWLNGSSTTDLLERSVLSNSTSYYDSYYNRGDKSGIRKQDVCGSLMYSNRNLELGIYSAFFSYHIGPEATLGRSATNVIYMPRQTDVTHGTAYAKYNDGRLFFNFETAWFYDTTNYDVRSPTFTEQWRYAAEIGGIAGPSKISFLVGFTPGLDRRNGTYIDRQAGAFLRNPELIRELAGIDIWKKYSYLMSYIYGSGLAGVRREAVVTATYNGQFYDDVANRGLNQEGSMLDSFVLATRLDYAVASNLNIFGNFLWAQRTSKSYPWGFISPDYYESNAALPYYTGNVQVNFDANPTAPSIPETALGYEIDLGLGWKLLENWTVDVVVSRWQPGKWFSYACVDKSTNWRNPTSGNNYGTNPSRTIDPIMAVRVDLTSSF